MLFVDFIYKILPYMIGGFMSVAGVLFVIGAVSEKEYEKIETKYSSSGIVLLIAGISIIIRGAGAEGLIGATLAIFGLHQGSESLNLAIYGLAHKEKWLLNMLQAIVQITIALLLFIDPVSKLYPHMRILGLELLTIGVHICREIKASGRRSAVGP